LSLRIARYPGSFDPVTTSERGSRFTTAGFAPMMERAVGAAKLNFKTHLHVLRHACGHALTN
jgi:type 1 fimbriae regulatory protein FimB/type 1 fimbriae regulatory protein FimE